MILEKAAKINNLLHIFFSVYSTSATGYFNWKVAKQNDKIRVPILSDQAHQTLKKARKFVYYCMYNFAEKRRIKFHSQ